MSGVSVEDPIEKALMDAVAEALGKASDKQGAIETHFELNEDNVPVTSMIVRDPQAMHRMFDVNLAWVPAVFGLPGDDNPEELDSPLPMMIVTSEPVTSPVDSGDHLERMLYTITQEQAVSIVHDIIQMFTDDHEQTDKIMHTIAHMIHGDDDE